MNVNLLGEFTPHAKRVGVNDCNFGIVDPAQAGINFIDPVRKMHQDFLNLTIKIDNKDKARPQALEKNRPKPEKVYAQ